MNKWYGLLLCLLMLGQFACSRRQFAYQPDAQPPTELPGYSLVWHDEFNANGKPDSASWGYELGFVRNRELQWYQPQNATCSKGVLVIEGRRENLENPRFEATHKDWRRHREFAEYTSASLHTLNKKSFQYGVFEVRARIDTAMGMWPAIWTLGVAKEWPAGGEIDLMEFYRVGNRPTILANAAWSDDKMKAVWDDARIPFSNFLEKDAQWPCKFHVWKMDWTTEYIKLYLDGELLNEIDLTKTLNPDGFNPFHQPHYLLLNLAIGGNGGNPSGTPFPKRYEVDYVRVYQKK
ncbi:glycoside hydrolase family 16 protein [Rufibacter latericius]|uniref:Glycoside hydrolase family 16 protein n=1 Tax=Rufibacter latericius TaxID=2487040 RepID=A0A3M9N0Z8_9BACT|nr:glycoside hydrolase family 16 protein [Rufibacter latericius]RNI31396.1 glycoside hydrolase family 16 protein [Rufibacter latericius]